MTLPRTHLYVVLGSGGVGKTTSAAAMALRFAEAGQKTLVITIDPAKRLAQALGLQSLSNTAQNVASFPSGGHLDALWLDTSSAFDDLVKRHGSSVKNADQILNNRLFKIIKSQLGGVEEYLGLEQVLRLGQSGAYDVCVLDTPPSRHALDFLESPKHLLAFFDDKVVRVFMGSSDEKSEEGFFRKILNSGRNRAIETFKSFLGGTFLAELAELLKNFEPVHRALIETATQIEAWVHSPQTRFVMVSLLENYPLDELRLLGLELQARDLPGPTFIVLNKCLPQNPPPAELTAIEDSAVGQRLKERFELQEALRPRVQREWSSEKTKIVELPRYSLKQLDREELLAIGRKIVGP